MDLEKTLKNLTKDQRHRLDIRLKKNKDIKLSLSNSFIQLSGRPYKLGGNGNPRGEAFDCFGMIVEYYSLRYGKDITKHHNAYGFDLENYSELYTRDPALSMKTFRLFLDSILTKVVLDYKMSGDILICSAEGEYAIGIYGGSQKMLITSPKTGCALISTDFYKVENAYRWLRSSQ